MRLASILLVIISFVLGVFSWWGINTVDGQHAYDEMAAIVPYSAGLVAVILAMVALLLFWLSRQNVGR